MDQTTKIAIGAAGLLLLVAVIVLGTTTKSTVEEIEQFHGKQKPTAKKDDPSEASASRTLAIVLIGALALAMCFVGWKFWSQYLNYSSAPEALKEPWQKYT